MKTLVSLALVAALAILALMTDIMPVAAQDSQPSALPRPDSVTPPSPTAGLIGLFVGGWKNPTYGDGNMEVRVMKVVVMAIKIEPPEVQGKAEGTVYIKDGVRPTGGHVKFYDGTVSVQNGQTILAFKRYAGPLVFNYNLQLGGETLVGTSVVNGVTSAVKLTKQ